jgi:multidrug efflux pump subunit AcrA (membrane-fusion protein)
MELVPTIDRLLVEARVQPQDIDNVLLGQGAHVRFLAFKQRDTPALNGTVSYVSADGLTDPATALSYFLARIEVSAPELGRLENDKLQPGVPAEVMIAGGQRTPLKYFLDPVLDSMNRAFREE